MIPNHVLKRWAGEARYRKEVGGLMLAGMPVATDDRSKLLIFAARTKAKEDAETTKRWKTDGGFVTLDAATLIAIGDAVEAHVTACFDLEDDVVTQIEAGTITTREQVDAAFA
jgi:hypothetical protein